MSKDSLNYSLTEQKLQKRFRKSLRKQEVFLSYLLEDGKDKENRPRNIPGLQDQFITPAQRSVRIPLKGQFSQHNNLIASCCIEKGTAKRPEILCKDRL